MNKFLSLTGLASKAGKTVSGEFAVEESVRRKKAKLVIVSEEASENTKKLFRNKCLYYHIPIFIFGTKQDLGKVTGNELRTSMAITDDGFARAIIEILNNK